MTYTVTLTVEGAGACNTFSDVITRQITVVNPPNSLFSVSDDDLIACRRETITFTNQSNDDTNITWSIAPSGGWAFIDTNMTVNSEVISVMFNNDRDYTITLTGRNDCDEVTSDRTISILEAPSVSELNDLTGCDEQTVSPAALGYNVSGTFTDVCWEFPDGNATNVCAETFGPVTFTASGRVRLVVTSLCGDITREAMVNVQSSAPPTLTAGSGYCTGSSPDTLTASSPGGRWRGPGITDPVAGVFDPAVAGSGTHIITYEITTGACQNMNTISVMVAPSTVVTTPDASFCLDGGVVTLTANPPGGEWSGTGITDPSGTFDPASAGPGEARPLYALTDGNSCRVEVSPRITVAPVPVLTHPDTTLTCNENEVVDLAALTGISSNVTGGTYRWTLNGTPLPNGTFNPTTDLPGPGNYTIAYTYENAPCTVTGGLILRIIEKPVLELTPQDNVCISQQMLRLAANLDDGTWSGPGIDATTGVIDLEVAGGGSFTYRYSFQPGGSCAQVAEQTVVIEDPGASIRPGEDQQSCETRDLTTTLVGASPGGGTWSGPGVTDGRAGTVDLTQLRPDSTYVYTYEIESSTTPGCSATATQELAYDPAPDPNFTIDGSPCINESFGLMSVQTGTGFSFDWDFGDGTTSTLADPTHTYAAGGTFTQQLTVTSPKGCPADTTATIYVTTPPSPSFALDSTLGCAAFVLNLNDASTGDDFTSFWVVGTDTLAGGGSQEVTLDGYLEDTEVSITLVAENFCGARTQVQSVVVKPYPAVDFGLDVDDGCSLFRPELSNVTLGNPDAFFWDMGEGTTGNDSIPPVVRYFTPADSVSVYAITLIATNECGRDTLVRNVTVYPPDVSAFISLDTISGCQPWSFQPRSFSTPGASLAWEVLAPDGTVTASGNEANPSFELNQVGVHRVILRAARCGEDADTVFVDVLPAPEVSFRSDPAVCLGDELLLTNTSAGITGGFYSLGNGNTLNQINGAVTYPDAGDYVISFTGYSALNNCPATVGKPVVVRPLPAVGIAASDTSGCAPLSVDLRNTTTSGTALTYAWDFDDATATSNRANPTHVYNTPGTYFPSLTVTDDLGCTNDTFFSGIIVHPDPVPAFTIETDRFCSGYDSLQLTETSTNATALSWLIDGVTYPGMPPVLPLGNPGAATVVLTATSRNGCVASTQRDYRVLTSPRASATVGLDTVCLNTAQEFISTATGATDIVWDLMDGTGGTEPLLVYTYGSPGDYAVTLIAFNDNGCPADTVVLPVRVNVLPAAGFSLTESVRCGTPANVTFTNTTSGGLAYDWAFGDGATTNELNPVHTYLTAGDYQPVLIAENEFGCRDTVSRELTVSGAPVAEFVRPPVLACSPYLLQLAAEPTEALRYEWYLDDAFTPVTGELFDTLLTDNRPHRIRLIAIYDEVCRDTLTVANLIDLQPRPVAGFLFQEDEIPNRLGEVSFQSTSTGGDEYFWDLGDGTFQTIPSFYHEYRINRDITVTHAITQRYERGLVCSDTLRQNVAPEWITRFFVPNAVSPQSGPEEVRIWGAKGFGVAEYELEVFSAYGQLLFATSELSDSQPVGRWDVKDVATGAFVLQGAYTWRAKVTYVDGNTENLVGTVTVLR